jgi:hypothetical protein
MRGAAFLVEPVGRCWHIVAWLEQRPDPVRHPKVFQSIQIRRAHSICKQAMGVAIWK